MTSFPEIISNPRQKAWLFWVLNGSYWIVFILREYLVVKYYGPSIQNGFLLAALTFFIGFIFTVIIRYLFLFIRRTLHSLPVLSLVFILLLLGFSVAWKFSDTWLSYPFWPKQRQDYYDTLTSMDHFMDWFQYILYIFVWGGIYFSFFLWERNIFQVLKTKEAENLAAQTRFQLLQNQLNPHFLFNSLNSIRALVFENQQKAADLVTDLSDFLRFNLNQSGLSCLPLSQEISVIEKYLLIEKKRFEEDLLFTLHIDPVCVPAKVIPNLLLPLVDNAVKHGIQTSPVPLNITISARKKGDHLVLVVFNTGFWSEHGVRGPGKGIPNVIERLKNSYPQQHGFHIRKEQDFVQVELTIPFVV